MFKVWGLGFRRRQPYRHGGIRNTSAHTRKPQHQTLICLQNPSKTASSWKSQATQTLNTSKTPCQTQVAGAKPLMNFGFHAGPTIETQILLPPTSVYYLPLPRFPMNDGCAFQQGASPASGCELTGVPFTEHPAGGFTFGRPFSNTSHCQVCPHASLSHFLSQTQTST